MRECAQCHVQDRPLLSGLECKCAGGEYLSHSDSCPAIEHFVVPDVQFIEKPEKLKKGWAYKFFQGRHAQIRNHCRECINRNEQSKRFFAQARKEALALENRVESDHARYIQTLCEG